MNSAAELPDLGVHEDVLLSPDRFEVEAAQQQQSNLQRNERVSTLAEIWF